nr:hypothetical protein [Streptomyces sp. WAC04114]
MPDSEDQEIGVVRGSEQGIPRGSVDDSSVYDDAPFDGRPVRHCRTQEGFGCLRAAEAGWILPCFLPAPGMHHDQVATSCLCLLEGEGDRSGVGVGSLPDAEDDLTAC